MKKKDKEKLREKTVEDLQTELAKTEEKLVEARIKLQKGQLDNYNYLGELKNKIAVIKTIIGEKKQNE